MALTMSSARSTFAGQGMAFRSGPLPTQRSCVARPVAVTVTASRICELTGVKRNKANHVSFSNKKSRKWQEPNLQAKKVYWAEGQRWVQLRICTRAIKTLDKLGLDHMASEAGIDLWKLPFVDARPQRAAYLQANAGKVPVAKDPRAMKNPERIAASRKQPRYPVYEPGGRIVFIKPGQEELIFGSPEEAKTGSSATASEEDAELKITLTE